jgi:hypothetical protein
MKKLVVLLIAVAVATVLGYSKDMKGYGGPDGFGYRWIDSNETGGPVYSWYDISSVGTNFNMGEWDVKNVNMGMSFSFYGTSYTSVDVFSKGYLSFVGGGEVKYDNEPMPNTSSPNGVIAPFWEDLDPSVQGGVYYYYDSANSRFIVQYNNVVMYGGNQSSTFQVILNSDGSMIFQYNSMNAPVNGCTVGIENQTGTGGLQIAYDQSYITNRLATRIYPTEVVIDGTFALAPTSLSYGNITLGKNLTKTFTISNTHATEKMSGSITTISGYTVSPASKTGDDDYKTLKNYIEYLINPGSSIVYDLKFEPAAAVNYNGFISISSSDSSHPTDSIVVTGKGVVPDIALSSTDTIRAAVYSGSSANKNFTIYNNDLGDLDYSISSNYLISDVYKGSGGPDNYNYFWKDSDSPTGPSYNWFDISALGIQLPTLADEALSSSLNLGFYFNFYGNSYNSVKVSSNGFLTFGSSNSFIPTTLPNVAVPNDIICPYWTDLTPSIQGKIYYYQDVANGRFIVQFDNIANFGTTNNNTFQMILYTNGVIEFQYKYISPLLSTVGIENSTGTDASMVAYGSSYLKNSLAVRFRPVPKWITLNPTSGTVLTSGSQAVSVGINSAGLSIGLHEANIIVASNDPDTPSITVPVKLNVYELTAPQGVTTSVSSGILTISWTAVPFATGYKVYSSNDPYGTFAEDTSGTPSGTSWSTSIVNAKKFYRVTALDAKGNVIK